VPSQTMQYLCVWQVVVVPRVQMRLIATFPKRCGLSLKLAGIMSQRSGRA
jgi:hypothetical protein